MAVALFDSGTQSATVTTEHTLASVDEAGVFQLVVDVNAMVAGDVLHLRMYTIVLTGGTTRLEKEITYYGVQTEKIKRVQSEPNNLTDTDSIKFTLTQEFGTSRSFPWKVLKVA